MSDRHDPLPHATCFAEDGQPDAVHVCRWLTHADNVHICRCGHRWTTAEPSFEDRILADFGNAFVHHLRAAEETPDV